MNRKKRYKKVEPPSLKLVEKEVNPKHDWWNDLTEDQKKDIEEGLADLEAGRVISSKEMWKQYGRKPRH